MGGWFSGGGVVHLGVKGVGGAKRVPVLGEWPLYPTNSRRTLQAPLILPNLAGPSATDSTCLPISPYPLADLTSPPSPSMSPIISPSHPLLEPTYLPEATQAPLLAPCPYLP